MFVKDGILSFFKLLNVALLILDCSSRLDLPHLCIARLNMQLPLKLVDLSLQVIHLVVYAKVKVDVPRLSR